MNSEKQIIIDWSRVRSSDYEAILLGIIFFYIYGISLAIICISLENVVGGFVVFIVQLGVGLPLTRHSLSLGRRAKSKVMFQDPAKLDDRWKVEEIETHNSDIQRIFENFQESVAKADKKTVDDINDMVWFILIVWSIFSSLLFVLFQSGLPVCMLSLIILVLASVISYIYGHRGLVNGYFEDDLSHLEYYVQSRMKVLRELEPKQIQKVIWRTRRNKRILADFCVDFPPIRGFHLKYHIGIPSDVFEQFTLEGIDNHLKKIATHIQERGINHGWEMSFTEDGSLRIYNQSNNINLENNRSFIETPEEPAYLREIGGMLLSLISNK